MFRYAAIILFSFLWMDNSWARISDYTKSRTRAAPVVTEELQRLQEENKLLKQEIAELRRSLNLPEMSPLAGANTAEEENQTLRAEVANLQAIVKESEEKSKLIQAAPTAPTNSDDEIARLKAELEAARTSAKPPSVSEPSSDELANLRAENLRLQKALASRPGASGEPMDYTLVEKAMAGIRESVSQITDIDGASRDLTKE